jgi:hypothetical protein
MAALLSQDCFTCEQVFPDIPRQSRSGPSHVQVAAGVGIYSQNRRHFIIYQVFDTTLMVVLPAHLFLQCNGGGHAAAMLSELAQLSGIWKESFFGT